MRFSYNQSDLTSALNSTFMKMEHSLSNARSKKSHASSFKNQNQSSMQKENLRNLEMEMGMTEFGGPDFNMEMDVDLGHIQRAEEIVNENYEKVRQEQKKNWLFNDENSFNNGALSEEKNIFKNSFSYTRDFNNQVDNMRKSLSRSKNVLFFKFKEVPLS